MLVRKVFFLLVVSLVFCLSTTLYAQTPNPQSDFMVKLNDAGDGVVITNYIGKAASVVIPSEMEGFPVVELGEKAFGSLDTENIKDISDVSIPDSVKIIGEFCFANLALTSITIPASVESVGERAFYEMRNLTTVVIENGETRFGRQPFGICKNIQNITLPDNMARIPSLFSGCSKLVSIKLPSNLKSIDGGAFSRCGLTSLELPETLETIGDRAFAYNEITSLILPSSLKEIGDSAFSGNSITDITFPEDTTNLKIASSAFGGNSKLSLKTQATLKKLLGN
jgi:hypothetical protein